MGKRNAGNYGAMTTPATPFGFAGARPGPYSPPKPAPGPTGIGAPYAGLDTAQPSMQRPEVSQMALPVGGGPAAPMGGGAFARPGEDATMEEYRAAQGNPQAMAMFEARNPGFVPPNAGILSSLQGQLQQLQPANGPGLQFDAIGNLLPGQQFSRFTPPPGW